MKEKDKKITWLRQYLTRPNVKRAAAGDGGIMGVWPPPLLTASFSPHLSSTAKTHCMIASFPLENALHPRKQQMIYTLIISARPEGSNRIQLLFLFLYFPIARIGASVGSASSDFSVPSARCGGQGRLHLLRPPRERPTTPRGTGRPARPWTSNSHPVRRR